MSLFLTSKHTVCPAHPPCARAFFLVRIPPTQPDACIDSLLYVWYNMAYSYFEPFRNKF